MSTLQCRNVAPFPHREVPGIGIERTQDGPLPSRIVADSLHTVKIFQFYLQGASSGLHLFGPNLWPHQTLRGPGLHERHRATRLPAFCSWTPKTTTPPPHDRTLRICLELFPRVPPHRSPCRAPLSSRRRRTPPATRADAAPASPRRPPPHRAAALARRRRPPHHGLRRRLRRLPRPGEPGRLRRRRRRDGDRRQEGQPPDRRPRGAGAPQEPRRLLHVGRGRAVRAGELGLRGQDARREIVRGAGGPRGDGRRAEHEGLRPKGPVQGSDGRGQGGGGRSGGQGLPRGDGQGPRRVLGGGPARGESDGRAGERGGELRSRVWGETRARVRWGPALEVVQNLYRWATTTQGFTRHGPLPWG